MTIAVDIQVQGGRVTITIGGQSASNANDGTVVGQGNVATPTHDSKKGGDGSTENPDPGGGGPGCGAVVIGPIVVDGSAVQGASGQGSANAGRTGGDGSTENPDPGGGGPGNGVLVIGPIVIGGAQAGGKAAPATATSVVVNPDVKPATGAAK
jgi:hypothetical protein